MHHDAAKALAIIGADQGVFPQPRLNMLGHGRVCFTAAPFFWSQHYDISINYVGHAARWDAIEVEGDVAARSAVLRYRRDGKVLAVATVGRDLQSLDAEVAMERDATAAPGAISG